ncbi:hypothetical protein NKI13_24535 [Mesorhizobium australicum]|uniref:hypothetical protein n=1 Tax=Mesorhizobium australicum TaxID=536018 RepID=UPI003339F554
MIEAIISLLIYVCVLALVIYVVIWILGQIGIALPPQVIKILWIIVTLIVLLMLVHLVLAGGFALPGFH